MLNILLSESVKKTYLDYAVQVLKDSKKPLTVAEICDAINDIGGNIPKSSYRSVHTIILSYTKGKEDISSYASRNKTGKILFEVDNSRPQKFSLVDSDVIKKFSEIDDIEDDYDDYDYDDQNPFKQAVCIIGESGAGKSVTIENILENEGHEYEFIIPTSTTTGLLAQFSPKNNGYIVSKLGKLIIEASKNPSAFYTAVIDECHKSNVMEMINDELLQAISTRRNNGIRSIQLDPDNLDLYSEYIKPIRGKLLIPNNFGFIFISSKPRIIANNPDFANRIDIIKLEEKDRNIDTIEELLSLPKINDISNERQD